MIKRSQHFNGKAFRFDGRDVIFTRLWGGVSFHGNFAVVVGEEDFFGKLFYYVLAECEEQTIAGLFDSIRQLDREMGVARWVGDLQPEHEDFLRTTNKHLFRQGLRTCMVYPNTVQANHLDVGVGYIYSLLRPEKLLHFFDLSAITSEIQAIPASSVKADDYPRVAALAYALSGMLRYGHERVSDDDLLPEPE